jgi:hypothetical protein
VDSRFACVCAVLLSRLPWHHRFEAELNKELQAMQRLKGLVAQSDTKTKALSKDLQQMLVWRQRARSAEKVRKDTHPYRTPE